MKYITLTLLIIFSTLQFANAKNNSTMEENDQTIEDIFKYCSEYKENLSLIRNDLH